MLSGKCCSVCWSELTLQDEMAGVCGNCAGSCQAGVATTFEPPVCPHCGFGLTADQVANKTECFNCGRLIEGD